jgi:hypothetical protein
MNVNPLIMVSIGAVDDVFDGLGGCCLRVQSKVKIISSSFCSFNRKDGEEDGGISGS